MRERLFTWLAENIIKPKKYIPDISVEKETEWLNEITLMHANNNRLRAERMIDWLTK